MNQYQGKSVNRKIFSAAVIIAFITALTKVIIFIKELLVAQYFGREDAMDAFIMAFTLTTFVISLLAGTLEGAIIPAYIRIQELQGLAKASQFVTNLMALFLVFLIAITMLMGLGIPLFLPYLAQGFNHGKLLLTQQLTYMLIPVILLSGLGYLWKAVLNACERFVFPAALPVITPLVTILCLLVGVGRGVYALVIGLLIGATLELILLAFVMKRNGWSILPGWGGITPEVRQVVGQYLPVVFGSVFMSCNPLVDQAMAATLSSGSLAALSYGQKIIGLPLSLGIMALGTAVLSYISKIVALYDWAGIKHVFRRYLALIFAITLPITAIVYVWSEPLIRLVFQRGAFTASDTVIVAQVQAFYVLQIPFYIGGILIVRMISSIAANSIYYLVPGINFLTNIILDIIFMKWFGVAGIALSTSVVYFFSFLYCWIYFTHKLSRLEKQKVEGDDPSTLF
jgi:putative peptidoglycan lipid II flippase